MEKFVVEIFAPRESEGNQLLHAAGVFKPREDRPELRMIATEYTQGQYRKIEKDLPAPIRAAFHAAAREIDSHALVDTLRFWAGMERVEMMSGDSFWDPVRTVEVPVEGFPGTIVSVEKYRATAVDRYTAPLFST